MTGPRHLELDKCGNLCLYLSQKVLLKTRRISRNVLRPSTRERFVFIVGSFSLCNKGPYNPTWSTTTDPVSGLSLVTDNPVLSPSGPPSDGEPSTKPSYLYTIYFSTLWVLCYIYVYLFIRTFYSSNYVFWVLRRLFFYAKILWSEVCF